MKYLFPTLCCCLLAGCSHTPVEKSEPTPPAPAPIVSESASGTIKPTPVSRESTGTLDTLSPSPASAPKAPSNAPITKTSTGASGSTSPESDPELDATMREIDQLFSDIEKGAR